MFSYIYNIIKRIKNAREYPLLLVKLKVYICLPTAGVVQVRLDPLLPSTYYIDSTKGILCFKGMFSMSRLGSSAQLHSTLRYFKLGSTHTHIPTMQFDDLERCVRCSIFIPYSCQCLFNKWKLELLHTTLKLFLKCKYRETAI